VSLLSPETLHVFFAPDALLALSRVGWRRRLGESRRYAVDSASQANNAPGASWQGALAGFAAALREFSCRRVRVVISHHFVQYRVLPWRDDLGGDAEYGALAQLEFAQAFGALAESWTIALADQRPGVPRVAAALPSDLLSALTSTAGAAGARLVAVQPYLAVVTDLWDRLGGKPGKPWLLVHEPGRLCLARRDGRNWRWLRHVRVAEHWAQDLPAVLLGEAMLAGLTESEVVPADVLVFAPGAGRDATAALRATGFQVLEAPRELGFMADRDGAYAPAWLG
jgi:hypothetical protein